MEIETRRKEEERKTKSEVGRKCKERTPGERSGLETGQEKGYGQICMEIPRVNLDTGR
jgi:hypothetical protein